MDEMIKHLESSLDQFKHDPADSDFQRGYEACLKELLRVANDMRNKS